MVLVLKKGASKKDIEEIKKELSKQTSNGGFDAKKYNGIIPSIGDPLAIQKKLRDEWERDIS